MKYVHKIHEHLVQQYHGTMNSLILQCLNDTSTASSKARSPVNEIQCFLFQFQVTSLLHAFIQ